MAPWLMAPWSIALPPALQLLAANGAVDGGAETPALCDSRRVCSPARAARSEGVAAGLMEELIEDRPVSAAQASTDKCGLLGARSCRGTRSG